MIKSVISIQNISDVITNSSSEIFICQSDNPEQTLELMREVLSSVYDNFKKARDNSGSNTYSYYGDSIDDFMTLSIAYSDGRDNNWGYTYKTGDILVESTDDNSIPSVIMDFIYEFFPYNKIQHHHLG